MGVAVATGHPSYSANFLPERWSTKLLVDYWQSLVVAQISNTDWESDSKSGMGDKVWIRTVPDVTVRDYSVGQELVVERPDSDPIYLPIDQAHYWNFACDDIVKYQSDLKLMSIFSKKAGYKAKLKTDQNVLGTIYSQAHSSNQGTTAGASSSSFNLGTSGSPIAITKTNVIEYIQDCETVLTEQSVPEDDGWWMIIPPWFKNLIGKSDIKDASLTGDPKSPIRTGMIGNIGNFTLYQTLNIETASDGGNTANYVQFGHRDALTFAAAITKTRAIESERTFATLVSGLIVYGFKVTKSEALGTLYCYKG